MTGRIKSPFSKHWMTVLISYSAASVKRKMCIRDSYTTEHEERFTKEGIPTKFLIARKAHLEKIPIDKKYLILKEPE